VIELGDNLPEPVLHVPLALSDGSHTTLAEQAGQWLVLYFYPKDNTPGCTTEGVEFNALLPAFAALNARVFGVSRDSVKSHANFCHKRGFRFSLISDSDSILCSAFDVIKPKNMFGNLVHGIERSTFVLSPKSQLLWQWRKVRAAGHAQAVLSQLQGICAYYSSLAQANKRAG